MQQKQEVKIGSVMTRMTRAVRLSWAGLGLAALAAVLLVFAGPGTQFGFWNFVFGLDLVRFSAWIGIAALFFALVALVMSVLKREKKARTRSLIGAVLAVMVIAPVLHLKHVAESVPRIHDITTDTENPPEFVEIVNLRMNALNPAVYGGPAIAAEQHQAYPDIQSRILPLSKEKAFDKALAVARDMGWVIVATDPASGRIEGTDTTPWFGFKDDVVIRVRPEGSAGARVDVRSVSRVGLSDLGKNAQRIRGFLKRLE